MFFFSNSFFAARLPAVACACVSTVAVLTFTNLLIT